MVTPPTRRDFASTHFLIGELAFVLFLFFFFLLSSSSQRIFGSILLLSLGLQRTYKLFSARPPKSKTQQKLKLGRRTFCFSRKMKMHALSDLVGRRREEKNFVRFLGRPLTQFFVSCLVSGINGVVIIHQSSSSLSSDCHSLLFFSFIARERGGRAARECSQLF